MSRGYSVQQKGGRWYCVFAWKGKQVWRSTGMADESAALRLAPDIKEAHIAQYYRDQINPPAPVVVPPRWATIAEIVATYRATNKRCNGDTEACAIARFQALVREISGCPRGKEGAQSSTILTRANAERWQAMRQKILIRNNAKVWAARLQQFVGAVPDLSTRQSVNVTINSMFRQACDVFARRYRNAGPLGALVLPPELEAFLSTPLLPLPRTGWKPWCREDYQRMLRAGDAIEDQELWLVHQLLRRLGLRTGELKAATSDWLQPLVGGGWALSVQDYPNQPPHPFQVKGSASRVLPLPPEIAAILRERSGYLIRGEREYRVFRGKVRIVMPLVDEVHVAWLRQFCPPEVQKPNHELRKWVGAIVYTTDGAEAARKFLGHSDTKTLQEHYSDYLKLVRVDESWAKVEAWS